MHQIFDRSKLNIQPLASRQCRKDISRMFDADSSLPPLSSEEGQKMDAMANAVEQAKENGAPIVLVYGAHLFRNGLSPLVVKLLEAGYIQHLATNGAGSIHDWELAFQGETEEDVRYYIKKGQFGIWEETGLYINLAVIVGGASGLGYGASIGKMIGEDMLVLPSVQQLKEQIQEDLNRSTPHENFSAKAALLYTMKTASLKGGRLDVLHPYKRFSIQCAAYRSKIPFSVCPGIGYDIIYSHPINNGAAMGQGALNDFLSLVQTISKLEKGVILVVGSSVMAPMIIEKAISMARNVAVQEKRSFEDFQIFVNDIQPGGWDWTQGEPPRSHPAYYLRSCKSFSRMGGHFQYFEMDNRVFIQHLVHRLHISDL
ncbi:MAG: hypothetical protein H8D23_18590 [Candidatus Brocadiales bacterium]|nr:hypothetical protein [Candidatus Brocadiales bacterium]